MGKPPDIIARMRANPADVRYADLVRVCDAVFGQARQSGGSHRVYKTPWPGDPRVNIQADRSGRAKAYQVRQVLSALDRMSTLGKIGSEFGSEIGGEVGDDRH
ncbi:MAG: hypothetical protein RLY86_2981 [Pseudomonadota bacterium]